MNQEVVVALNMTKFFTREILIYSFFDMRLKKPFRVIYGLYFLLLLLTVSLPLFFLLKGFGLTPVTLTIILGPAFLGASTLSKPIWGGKSFFDFIKTQIQYIKGPKAYYDLKADVEMGTQIIDFEITVSRRKDFIELYKIDREELKWASQRV